MNSGIIQHQEEQKMETAKAEALNTIENAKCNQVGAGAKDPWAHRNQGMRCRTCMWFAEKGQRGDFGRCRRHAPTMSGYPAVFVTDWCGDHKLDETKI
jgi:hypothetical protein